MDKHSSSVLCREAHPELKRARQLSRQQRAVQLLRHMVQDVEKGGSVKESLAFVSKKKQRLKALQRYRRMQARLDYEGEDALWSRRDETRSRKWARACAAKRREHENHILVRAAYRD